MKRNEVFVLEKSNRNTIKIYWMKIFDHQKDSGIKKIYLAKNNLYRVNLSKLTQTLDSTLITNGFANIYTEIVTKLKKPLLALTLSCKRKQNVKILPSEHLNFVMLTFKNI